MEFINKYLINSWVINSAIIFLSTLILDRIVRKIFKVLNRKQQDNVTNIIFLKRVVTSIIWILGISAFLIQFEPFKKFVTSFLASSGILAVIIGFASQEAVGNLVSGMFISFFKPFKLNDRIKIVSESIDGIVEDMSLRHTVIRTFSNSRIVVPNSLINKSVLENVNFSDTKVCNFLNISISYDSNIDKAMLIIKELSENHSLILDNRTQQEIEANKPKVDIKIIDFLESGIALRAYIWSETVAEGFQMLSDLRYEIKKEFDKNGIQIPFPTRTVYLKDKK